MINFKDELNERQYEAVTSTSQYLRIVAGAGSGKTRVLTYRIAHLVANMGVSPRRIVAITFTNKVAGEMKRRVIDLIHVGERDMQISTFHSLAVKILRNHIHLLNYPTSFTILDEEDQAKLFNDIAKELGYSKRDQLIKTAINYISNEKCKGHYPEDIELDDRIPNQKLFIEIYYKYETRKSEIYAYDFDDLILKAIDLLKNYSEVRKRYLNEIDHILVDEFQDTNDVQYEFMNLLMDSHTSLYVVGDPDQTIYTWRGANQKIIMDLEKRFPLLETIILDRNYRSTKKILDAANSLIGHNRERVKKNLYTENASGDNVNIIVKDSPQEEAKAVAETIKKLKDSGKYDYKDIAIIYRSNYLTLDFEHALMALRIPYRVYGGLRFYQRKEIKDVLAYFRLVANVKDDLALLRIINIPRRGLGEKILSLLMDDAREAHLSLYELIDDKNSRPKYLKVSQNLALDHMCSLIDKAREAILKKEKPYYEILQKMIIDLGYIDYLAQDDEEEDRIDNVMALFEDAKNYALGDEDATFEAYLQNVALLSAQDDINEGDNVSLLTVHTAKGLEYPVVFLVRLSEGIFPNQKTLMEGFKNLEEERRLCYVAFTRAKKELYVTHNSGYSYVLGCRLAPSRFFKEAMLTTSVDKKKEWHFEGENKKISTIKSHMQGNPVMNSNGIDDWVVGDRLEHRLFGKGTVTSVKKDSIIEVHFDAGGTRLMLGNHPTIKRIEKKGNEA